MHESGNKGFKKDSKDFSAQWDKYVDPPPVCPIETSQASTSLAPFGLCTTSPWLDESHEGWLSPHYAETGSQHLHLLDTTPGMAGMCTEPGP